MKYVPKSVTRLAGRSMLKLSASSPTLLVVGGVVGLGVTAVLAAKATRNIDPVLDLHHKRRTTIKETVYENKNEYSRQLLGLYVDTSIQLTRVYGPALVVGSISAAAVLSGHRILRSRHIATMAAYSGLAEQFANYRGRVAKTLGEDVELGIYEGAHGEWVEDPDHKGEYKLQPKFEGDPDPDSYLRPWFDETNSSWRRDPVSNKMVLTGIQNHMNQLLQIRGHVTLNDVYDALGFARIPVGQIAGWKKDNPKGDSFVDFGFLSSIDPDTMMFNEGVSPNVRLNFNIDRDSIYELI